MPTSYFFLQLGSVFFSPLLIQFLSDSEDFVPFISCKCGENLNFK